MFRLTLAPGFRFSAPIIQSAIARSGATVAFTFAHTSYPNRSLLRKYQVCDLLAPSHSTSTATSTLFATKRCLSSTPSTTTPLLRDYDFYFNPEVINHVLSVVSKNFALKAVFEATNRTLSGPLPSEINENNIASRYDETAAGLKAEQLLGVEKLSNKNKILVAVTEALPVFKVVVSSDIFSKVPDDKHSLLLATIFVLRCFSTSATRITAESLDQRVRKLDPYLHLSQLALQLQPQLRLEVDVDSSVEQLIKTIFATAKSREDNINKEFNKIPQIIRLITEVHERQGKDELRDQCEFVSESHTTVACTENGKGVCASRFVNPDSGAGVVDILQLQWSSKGKNDQSDFDSDAVNIVSGASGSGKTISSLICGATAAKPVYCLLLHAKSDCAATDLKDSIPSAELNEVAFDLLKKGIRKILQPASEFAFERKWKGVLRIVVDEIGTHPVLLHALCAVWQHKRSDMAQFLGVSQDCLQLVAVGTGADNFELSKLGSVRDAYKVLVVARNDVIFKKLFRQKMKAMNGATQLPPASQLYRLLFGENPFLREGVSDTTSLPSPTTDPVFRALLRLVTNARCAAIILSLMHRSFVNPQRKPGENSQSMQKNMTTAWPPLQLRATVSYWCVEAINIYCTISGMASLNAPRRHFVLGQAIAYDLNRSLCMKGNTECEREKEWRRYGVHFGLLSDTAREMEEDDGTMQFVYDQPRTDATGNDGLPRQQFGIPVGTSRFRVDDAFVMMFLLLSDTASNGVFAKNYTNVHLLFEEAMFDYQLIAAQFGRRRPVAEILNSITDDAQASKPEQGFTPPHLLYGLDCHTVYSSRLNFRLEEKLLVKRASLEVLQRSVYMWRDKVHGGSAVVLLNGTAASCADIVTLAPNRIIFTQCKNGGIINATMIPKEICKMRRKKLLSLLCWCVSTKADRVVEVFYVIAGGEKKRFCDDPVNGEAAPEVELDVEMEVEDEDADASESVEEDGAKQVAADAKTPKIKQYLTPSSRYEAFNTTKLSAKDKSDFDSRGWLMMPLDENTKKRSCAKLCATIHDGAAVGTPVTYRLHESIHFTYAYPDEQQQQLADGGSIKTFPFSPVLKSQLPAGDAPISSNELDYSEIERIFHTPENLANLNDGSAGFVISTTISPAATTKCVTIEITETTQKGSTKNCDDTPEKTKTAGEREKKRPNKKATKKKNTSKNNDN